MDSFKKRLLDSYYQNEKAATDNEQRKSTIENVLESSPMLCHKKWKDSEKNEAMMRKHLSYSKKGYRDLCDSQDIGFFGVGNTPGKALADIPSDSVTKNTVSEIRYGQVSDKARKKKKKEKKKDNSNYMDNRLTTGPRNISMPITDGMAMRRSERRELDIDSVVKTLKEQHSFICIAGRKLYAFTGKVFEDITDKNHAAAVFKEFLSEETNRLIRDYTEIYNQLLSDKDIWYSSMDDIRKNRDVIVFENGTYDVLREEFYEGRFWEEDYVFSIRRFEYHEGDMRGKEFVDDFIDTFCNGEPGRKKLFKQIVGICISNYGNKKACFYFLGVPNAGKSTVCRFLEIAVGSDAYISVAVKQLNSRFVSGDLEGIKICADEDVAIRTPLRSEDISLIKKITSSDKIRTDAKYQKPGQLHPECKLVWAGNGMMTFETSEDLQPLIDRMIIFPLDKAIPEEQRDPNIIDKLIMGRNYIISEALKALHDLVERNFQFTKVVPTEAYFTAQNFSSGIEAFVEECCILDENSREGTTILHRAYVRFCEEHPEYKAKSMNQFSSYLERKYNLQSYNDGNVRGKIGIQLCVRLRTDAVS